MTTAVRCVHAIASGRDGGVDPRCGGGDAHPGGVKGPCGSTRAHRRRPMRLRGGHAPRRGPARGERFELVANSFAADEAVEGARMEEPEAAVPAVGAGSGHGNIAGERRRRDAAAASGRGLAVHGARRLAGGRGHRGGPPVGRAVGVG